MKGVSQTNPPLRDELVRPFELSFEALCGDGYRLRLYGRFAAFCIRHGGHHQRRLHRSHRERGTHTVGERLLLLGIKK
jgi:hypothetical protein